MIFSVAALLTAQAESQMRHCARVNLQPQVHVSALKRWSIDLFCSGVSFREVDAGKFGSRDRRAREKLHLALVLEGFDLGHDGHAEELRARISVS